MSGDRIPFLDLVTVHRELEGELLSVFKTALDTAGFIGGPTVQEQHGSPTGQRASDR